MLKLPYRLLQVELCPPQKCGVLTPSTCDCDLIWKQSLSDDEGKMRSLGWALILYDCVLTKRGNLDRETDIHIRKMI